MTLDERVREGLKSAGSDVGPGSPAPVADVKRRGLRRRRTRRTVWIGFSAIPVLAFLAFTIPFDPNPIDPASSHSISTVEVADLAVPVTDARPVSTSPDTWIGLPGPTPQFDTTHYGPDLSFAPGEPEADALDDRVVRAVYLGELDGVAFYITSQPAPSIWDRIFESLDGNFSGDTLGTSLNCCSGGDMDRAGGLPGFSISAGTGLPTLVVAEWLGLPPDVSVVAYQVEGEFIGWQTPVGGAVSLRLDDVPGEVALVALDAEGIELDRFTVLPNDRPATMPSEAPSGPEEMVANGFEIGLDDVRPEDLRNQIELDGDSRLYEVPVAGTYVYVVIEGEEVHVYAESCSDLSASFTPEGIDVTCLDD